MTICVRRATVLCLVLAVAACRATGPTATPPQGSADATADAAECRQVADDRAQNLPAVRSGQTTYVPGGPAPYYEACMKQRGHDTYPPY